MDFDVDSICDTNTVDYLYVEKNVPSENFAESQRVSRPRLGASKDLPGADLEGVGGWGARASKTSV